MFTRLEITYKSLNPYTHTDYPDIFTTGGYAIKLPDGRQLQFDFEDMCARCEILVENNGERYLYFYSTQTSLDEDVLSDQMSLAEAYEIILAAKKEDFVEIFYESELRGEHIPLVPLSMTFYDFSDEGTGLPQEVPGENFELAVQQINTDSIANSTAV